MATGVFHRDFWKETSLWKIRFSRENDWKVSGICDRIERMYESLEEWRANAKATMARYAALRRVMDDLEAEVATVLGEVVEAYVWPEGIEIPQC